MVPTYLNSFNQTYIQGQATNPRGKTVILDSETHLSISKQKPKTHIHTHKNSITKKIKKWFYKVSTTLKFTLSNTEAKRQKEEREINKTHIQ